LPKKLLRRRTFVNPATRVLWERLLNGCGGRPQPWREVVARVEEGKKEGVVFAASERSQRNASTKTYLPKDGEGKKIDRGLKS